MEKKGQIILAEITNKFTKIFKNKHKSCVFNPYCESRDILGSFWNFGARL